MSGIAPVGHFPTIWPTSTLLLAGSFFSHLNLNEFFELVSALGSALAALNLYRAGLHREYRIFFAYLVFRSPCVLVALILGWTGQQALYFQFFTWTEPISVIFYVLIVFELYRLVLSRYKGLYTLGRWAMAAATALAIVISIVSLTVAKQGAGAGASKPSQSVMVFELGAEARIDLALVVFIVLIVWFMSRYPIYLNRNVIIHTVVYSVFFFANALGLVLWLFNINVITPVNLTLMGIASACAVAWWIGLTAKGEEVQVHLPALGAGAEERVLQQLDALNATLLKVSRK